MDKKIDLTWRQLGKIFLGMAFLGIFLASVVYSNRHKVAASPLLDTLPRASVLTEIEADFDAAGVHMSDTLIRLIGAYTILNRSDVKPTEENVSAIVDLCGFHYPEVIMAQYKLESASGKSMLVKTNANLFGMKKAFSRLTVRCKTTSQKGYAEYNHWVLSIIDRWLWDQAMFKSKPNKAEYMAKIKRVYAEDTRYVNKLNIISKRFI